MANGVTATLSSSIQLTFSHLDTTDKVLCRYQSSEGDEDDVEEDEESEEYEEEGEGGAEGEEEEKPVAGKHYLPLIGCSLVREHQHHLSLLLVDSEDIRASGTG